MTDEKKVKMYLAIDGINGDREEFETIDEARMWLEECFLDSAEGYHPDFASCKIYQLAETVECDVVDKKENYKYTNEGDIPEDDNESEAWPYDTSFDEIWKHRFVPHAAQQKSEIAQRCPVCGGNGLVPNGFYNTVTGIGSTTSIAPETCRTCNGSGVYVQKSEIKMPTEEEIQEAAYSYACCAPIVGQSRMGFRAGIEWLRNQITEKK